MRLHELPEVGEIDRCLHMETERMLGHMSVSRYAIGILDRAEMVQQKSIFPALTLLKLYASPNLVFFWGDRQLQALALLALPVCGYEVDAGWSLACYGLVARQFLCCESHFHFLQVLTS